MDTKAVSIRRTGQDRSQPGLVVSRVRGQQILVVGTAYCFAGHVVHAYDTKAHTLRNGWMDNVVMSNGEIEFYAVKAEELLDIDYNTAEDLFDGGLSTNRAKRRYRTDLWPPRGERACHCWGVAVVARVTVNPYR